jgi:hypothetical protein
MGEGLKSKFEDLNALYKDISGDWLEKSGNRLAMAATSVMIIAAYI